MATKVIMPQLGESVDEGTINRWIITEGDKVKEYDPLLEINTDKVDTEIPSPASGTVLKILIPEGTTIHAGTLLAWIGQPGESLPSGAEPVVETSGVIVGKGSNSKGISTEVLENPIQASPLIFSPGRHNGLGFISPLVAKITSENKIDLSQVTGTGENGRITKNDVLSYLEKREASNVLPSEKPSRVSQSPIVSQIPTIERPPTSTITPQPLPGEVLPLTSVRKSIAEHMVFSKQTSPHVTTIMEVDLSQVIAHRQANKDQFAKDGVNLTFTAYFVSASIAGLKAKPIVNSSWSDQGIVIHRDINIGIAASLGEQGLIVPVIKNADSLSLLGIARAINDLANRARNRQLKPDEVKGGTFTITNHGVSGSLFANPIINQPQCAILGVGLIQKRVVVINDAIAIRPMAYLSLTFDHRILDGAIADVFLGKVVEFLQNWPEGN
jgi:pyruvate/2-oxoglutarate dehydrogenase complex dihydrolipoamide acyltransferase (E2) component